MNTLRINGKTITYEDSIDNLSMDRFMIHTRYVLIDSGVGSDLDTVDQHYNKMAQFFVANQPKKALAVHSNLRQSVYFIMSNLSTELMAFMPLITHVGNVAQRDLSDDGLKKLHDKLAPKITKGALSRVLDSVKKKSIRNYNRYTPVMSITLKWLTIITYWLKEQALYLGKLKGKMFNKSK